MWAPHGLKHTWDRAIKYSNLDHIPQKGHPATYGIFHIVLDLGFNIERIRTERFLGCLQRRIPYCKFCRNSWNITLKTRCIARVTGEEHLTAGLLGKECFLFTGFLFIPASASVNCPRICPISAISLGFLANPCGDSWAGLKNERDAKEYLRWVGNWSLEEKN